MLYFIGKYCNFYCTCENKINLSINVVFIEHDLSIFCELTEHYMAG